MADIVGASVHGVSLLINLYFAFVSMQSEIVSCAWPPFATETTKIPRPDERLRYAVRLMDLGLLDFIRLVEFGLRSFGRHYQPSVWNSIYEPVLSIIYAAALTTRLETLVDELDKIMVGTSIRELGYRLTYRDFWPHRSRRCDMGLCEREKLHKRFQDIGSSGPHVRNPSTIQTDVNKVEDLFVKVLSRCLGTGHGWYFPSISLPS